LKALMVFLKGIDTEKPMAPEIPLNSQRPANFVFDGLIKTLTQQRAEEEAASRQAEQRSGAASNAA